MAKRNRERMARSRAAEEMAGEMPEEMPGGGGGGGLPLPDLGGAGGGMMPPPLPGGGGPEDAENPQASVDAALAGLDSALAGLPPEQAEEARMHAEAIREIVAGSGGQKPEGEMPPDAPPPGGEVNPPGAEMAAPPSMA